MGEGRQGAILGDPGRRDGGCHRSPHNRPPHGPPDPLHCRRLPAPPLPPPRLLRLHLPCHCTSPALRACGSLREQHDLASDKRRERSIPVRITAPTVLSSRACAKHIDISAAAAAPTPLPVSPSPALAFPARHPTTPPGKRAAPDHKDCCCGVSTRGTAKQRRNRRSMSLSTTHARQLGSSAFNDDVIE